MMLVWFIPENVFSMSSLLRLCFHRDVQLWWVPAGACDFGRLTLSAFPVIFIIYKMTFKGCPMVVLQYVTEGTFPFFLCRHIVS